MAMQVVEIWWWPRIKFQKKLLWKKLNESLNPLPLALPQTLNTNEIPKMFLKEVSSKSKNYFSMSLTPHFNHSSELDQKTIT